MEDLTTLQDYFLFYVYTNLNSDDNMYADFWTEVAVLMNKWEEKDLTNNAVRKRFRRRLKTLKKKYNQDPEGLSEFDKYVTNLWDDLYIEDVKDQEDFTDNLIDVLRGESDWDIEEVNSKDELTEKEFEKDQKIRENSILQQVDVPYYFNEETGTYVFWLKSKSSKPLVIEEEDLKALKRRYSNWDGDSSTINEICRDFGIPRRWFTKLKTSLGWTHDSDPFLDKEIMEKEDDELVEEVLENKRRKLYQKMRMVEWDEVQKKAKKFDEIQATVVHPLQRKIEEQLGGYEPFNINLNGVQGDSELYFVFSPTDIHMNKLPYDTEKFTIGGYEKEVEDATNNLFNKVFNKLGEPEEIISIIGSDLFHVDNTQHATSAGTSQAGQVFGSYYDVLMSSYKTMYNIADIMVSTGVKNDMYTIRGNHDAILSLSIGMALEQRYLDQDHVTVDNRIDDRKYRKIGKFLIGMLHGEYLRTNQTTRNREIQGRILADAKKHKINVADVLNYYMFSGHTHKSSSNHNEDTGVFDIVCPSLSVTDWWHHLHNYEGNTRSISGYAISPYAGLQYIVFENADMVEVD